MKIARPLILFPAFLLFAIGQSSTADKIVAGARRQLISPAMYTGGYYRIAYPNGDVPGDRGACTDVLIRSLRNAGYDLQKLVHEDMRKNFSSYPRRESKPDPNIDHRRVPNLIHFFHAYGRKLPGVVTPATLATWKPGDLVFWKLDNGLDHCGVLSDRKNALGVPLVIHNMQMTREEDVLTAWKIVGHYRYPRNSGKP